MGLTKRELATVDETHQDRYSVSIMETEGGLWKLVIELDEIGRRYELDTTRGGARAWRHLEDAVKFALVNCSRARTVRVDVETWSLERVRKESSR
jgi:hypothetical protein